VGVLREQRESCRERDLVHDAYVERVDWGRLPQHRGIVRVDMMLLPLMVVRMVLLLLVMAAIVIGLQQAALAVLMITHDRMIACRRHSSPGGSSAAVSSVLVERERMRIAAVAVDVGVDAAAVAAVDGIEEGCTRTRITKCHVRFLVAFSSCASVIEQVLHRDLHQRNEWLTHMRRNCFKMWLVVFVLCALCLRLRLLLMRY